MKYFIMMKNGDNAEAETLSALLLAALTLYNDQAELYDGKIGVKKVTVNEVKQGWAWYACCEHIREEVVNI